MKWPFQSRQPDGSHICCWCGKPVPKGRRSWCGEACVQDWRNKHDWPHIRRQVFLRDRGVCAHCGVDTEKIRRIMQSLRGPKVFQFGVRYEIWKSMFVPLGFLPSSSMDQWQADHIRERVRGGGNELSNLRTLCVPCHKIETSRLAGELAAERKTKKEAAMSEIFNIFVPGEPYGQPRASPTVRGRRPSMFLRTHYGKHKMVGGRKVPDPRHGQPMPWYQFRCRVTKAIRPFVPHRGILLPARTPVRLDIDFYFERPAELLKPKYPRGAFWMTIKPDGFDNCAKLIGDAVKDAATLVDGVMVAGIWADDCQVCAGEVRKYWAGIGDLPGGRVVVTKLSNPEPGLFGDPAGDVQADYHGVDVWKCECGKWVPDEIRKCPECGVWVDEEAMRAAEEAEAKLARSNAAHLRRPGRPGPASASTSVPGGDASESISGALRGIVEDEDFPTRENEAYDVPF